MEIMVDGKEIKCKEMGIVGYNPTVLDGGNVVIFAKGKWVTKANLHFENEKEAKTK